MRKENFPKNDVDKLVMLLSTDWFSGYWRTAGIRVDAKISAVIQRGCREIVKQIVGEAEEYWHISFSGVRVEQTRSLLQALLKESGNNASHEVNAILVRASSPGIDEGSKWLLKHLTQMIVYDSEEIKQIRLDPVIKGMIENIWNEYKFHELEEIDFKVMSRKSNSQWDRYIESLTPDMPSYLSDYLMVEIIGNQEFEIVWELIQNKLDPKQKLEMLDWYLAAGRLLSGRDIILPPIDRPI